MNIGNPLCLFYIGGEGKLSNRKIDFGDPSLKRGQNPLPTAGREDPSGMPPNLTQSS